MCCSLPTLPSWSACTGTLLPPQVQHLVPCTNRSCRLVKTTVQVADVVLCCALMHEPLASNIAGCQAYS